VIALLQALYPPTKNAGHDPGSYTRWFMGTFALVLIVTAMAAVLIAVSGVGFSWPIHKAFSNKAPNTLTFFGLSLLVGSAGFAGGGFLGFLFGVPRVRTSEGGAEKGVPSAVISNTNLEQLSDWLTKIVVGITLVQLHQVNELLQQFSDRVDGALDDGSHSIHGAGFASCLILIGSGIAGFLGAYLKSKTDLMFAFRPPIERVQSALGLVIQGILVKSAREVLDRPNTEPDSCSRDAAAKLIQSAPPDASDAELLQLIGLAHAVLKNFKAAGQALQKAVDAKKAESQDDDEDLKALAMRALALAGDDQAAKSMAAGPVKDGPLTAQDIENALATMFSDLYAREGYLDAIAIGEKLAKDAAGQKSGRLWLYLASAYGQQHAALLRSHDASPDAIQDVRAKALMAVKEAIRVHPEANLDTLRIIWDPTYAGKPAAENDLESFYGDPAFQSLLERDRTA
jgi:tetratricopeptide (TPR) repeat protein